MNFCLWRNLGINHNLVLLRGWFIPPPTFSYCALINWRRKLRDGEVITSCRMNWSYAGNNPLSQKTKKVTHSGALSLSLLHIHIYTGTQVLTQTHKHLHITPTHPVGHTHDKKQTKLLLSNEVSDSGQVAGEGGPNGQGRTYRGPSCLLDTTEPNKCYLLSKRRSSLRCLWGSYSCSPVR